MALQQCAGLTLVLHHLHHKADVRKQPKLNCKDITVGTLQHFSYKYFVNSDFTQIFWTASKIPCTIKQTRSVNFFLNDLTLKPNAALK